MEDPRRDQTFRRGIEAQEGGAIARLSILQQHTNGIAVTELSKRIALKTTGALKRLSRPNNIPSLGSQAQTRK